MERQGEERVWSAPPDIGLVGGTLGVAMALLIPAVLFFFATGLRYAGEAAMPMAQRWAGLVGIPLFGAAMGGGLHFLMIREIRASHEWLTLRTGIRTMRIPRAKIRGVRLSRSSVEVVYCNSLGGLRVNTKGAWGPGIGGALLALYGPLEEESKLQAAVCAPEVVDRSQRASTFCAVARSRWSAGLGVLAVVCTVAGGVAWRRVFEWMVGLNLSWGGERAVFGLGWLVVGCGLLLGLVEAWRVFLSNEARAIEVDEGGVTIKRRWGTKRITAERIKGVSVSVYGGCRQWIVIHDDSWRGHVLREWEFEGEPGVLAGVMLNRFGEVLSLGWRAPAFPVDAPEWRATG